MFSRRDIFSLLTVCASLFVIIQCQVCQDNRMYYSPTITCKNISGRFPTFNRTIFGLKCLDCNIPVVDENTISSFKGDTFNLSFSHVESISSEAFASFDRTVHKFLFEGNNIYFIGAKAFSNFSALDEVVLRKNNIAQLPDGMFENTTVSFLDLSQNHLSNISVTFAGLKVNTLNLSVNEITDIPENAFERTTFYPGRQWRTKPQALDLSNNFIEKVHPNTFKFTNKDNNLRSLYFKNNKITTIENNTFVQLNLLTFLSLEENYISELYTGSFKGLTSLRTLFLGKNRIEKIPLGMFADLQNLEFLDFSQNQLSAFTMNTFSGLTQLTKLNISHNKLQMLEDIHLFPLGGLITLDISDNKLKDLNLEAILAHHYKLRVLVINDNFWTCTHLVQMYKQMNERLGGFDYPSHHYDVPNLHGIACSRGELSSYEDLTFDDFMNAISQDRVFEDLFDSRINNQDEGLFSVIEIFSTISRINGIFYMLLVITIIIVILFIHFIARSVCLYLYKRNTLPSKFCFAYNSNHDNVELI